MFKSFQMEDFEDLGQSYLLFSPAHRTGRLWRADSSQGGTPEDTGSARKVHRILGPKLLLPMGCVKLDEKNCVHLPSVGEQTAN